MPLGISDDCTPVRDTGVRVLGHGNRPQIYASLCEDDAFGSARAPAGNEVLVLPRREGNTAKRDDYRFDLTVNAPNTSVEAGRTSFVPTDETVREASMNSRVFGAGSHIPFRSEKPPQGIQFLRPFIDVPIDATAAFMAQPTHAGWNTFKPSEILQSDPRYVEPKFRATPGPALRGAPDLPREQPAEPLGMRG